MKPPRYIPLIVCAAGVIAASYAAGQSQQKPAALDNRMIDAARGAAMSFITSMPDYIVKRTTTRYMGQRMTLTRAAPGIWEVPAVNHWKPLDSIAADVGVEHGREIYTNITVNGKPAKALPSGTWSTGEFSSTLLEVLSPESAAVFANERGETLRNRATVRYDYTIDKGHSIWNISAGPLPDWPGTVKYTPAYEGALWIDSQTAQILRIEKSARGMPNTFPLDVILEATDYDYVKIGDHVYCLPTHSEAVNCEWGSNTPCWKNETAFQNYDKFSAKTTITFEDPVK